MQHGLCFTKEELLKLVYQAAGAATGPLMSDHPDYVFPAEKVAIAVGMVVYDQTGIDLRGYDPSRFAESNWQQRDEKDFTGPPAVEDVPVTDASDDKDPPDAVAEKLLATTDIRTWAQEFMGIFGNRLSDVDETVLVGWFANFEEALARNRAKAGEPATPFEVFLVGPLAPPPA